MTSAFAQSAQHDYPITPVPFTDVEIQPGFWGQRLDTNRNSTLPANWKKCEESGRMKNFAVAAGREEGGFTGTFPFNDSDVFKVIEGASYELAQHPDEKQEAYIDTIIELIGAAQEENGYLFTPLQIDDPNYRYLRRKERWVEVEHSHELYNMGHMYEAAVAHYQATGKRNFLDIAIKSADLICSVFGPGEDQLKMPPGHEEIEIGLVKLYRATGDEKYLQQAKFFIDMRGRSDLRERIWGPYSQDHKPVIEQDEAVGHAVRACYLYCSVVDVAAMTGDKDYMGAIDRIWENVATRKLHLSGGVGARHAGEAFGDNYELPNASAYLETCAAVANALWNHRMFLLHGDSKYIDVLERVIYNGFLSGVSLSGDHYFYPNPLCSHGGYERSAWFDCSCCPDNILRFMPAIPGLMYAVRDNVAYMNLYANSKGEIPIKDGKVVITQETEYPWDGKVQLKIDSTDAGEFEMRLHVPGWAQGKPVPSDLYMYMNPESEPVTLTVNGVEVNAQPADGYLRIQREWQAGDVLELNFPMPIRRVLCNEKVAANRGRVAIERGPVVYCIEGADHDGQALNIALPDDAELTMKRMPLMLGGICTIEGQGVRHALGEDEKPCTSSVALTAIPYYAWANRGANEMNVWLPRDPDMIPIPPVAHKFKASTSFETRDRLSALNDGVDPLSSDDHDAPRMTWWNHLGTKEWAQYDFDKPRKVRAVEVYWFDDTGRGECRVPKSWKLLYQAGEEWKPVEGAKEYPTERHCYNRVEFTPVETDGLRLDVQLWERFSSGIIEWRVEMDE
ncbi:glycoside hydrolase family 127 protein [Candidatus Sumerlaeota bacterium]|nr:glycoside hydrolase family 127 protein [Candidatus Sumerlaeota bacterium]